MTRGVLLAAAVLAASLAMASATIVQEQSTVHVVTPPQLAGFYVHSEALFGAPVYGGSITGKVVYGTPGNNTGCDPITPDPAWGANPIIMVDRGDCMFAAKARNAELAGAAAVIIINNVPLCGPASDGGSPGCESCANCCSYNCAPTACTCRLPYMASDSSGADVNIPAAMISEADGERWKACLHGQSPCSSASTIIVTLEWSMPTSNGVVTWELWAASWGNSLPFINQFRPFVKEFGAAMQFEPHYFVYDGAGWNCTQQTAGGQWVCASICSNQGRYCMLPFGYLYGLDGLDIIRENLRQICIWQQAKATYATDFGEQWWDYVARFKQNCAGSQFKNDTCSEIQQMAAGLDPAATVNCMASSGGLSNDGDNTLLAHGLRERTTLDVMMLPTFIVNGVVERGRITADQVLHTVCTGYVGGTAPSICSCINSKPEDITTCLNGGGGNNNNPPGDEGLAGWAIALLIMAPLVTFAIGAGFYVLHRRSRAEMREILQQYQTLPDATGTDRDQDDDLGNATMGVQLRPVGAVLSTAPGAGDDAGS